MSRSPDPSTAAVLATFLERFLADQAKGRVRPVVAYQRDFPGFETAIAREYASLTDRIDEGRTTVDAPPDAPFEAPRAPDAIGHYRIVRELGRGGQGEVYLAEDRRLRRSVALKVLRGIAVANPDGLRRFKREAELAARLDHPDVATVYESGVADGIAYLAMRFVEGDTLAKRIAAEPPPATRDAIDRLLAFFERIARALHAAHELGIVHRDVKPGNVIVTETGDPVVVDFGLARDVDGDDDVPLTVTGDVFGTPHYMSPEQLADDPQRLDRRTDVYSLGTALYEAMTGRRPFDAPTRARLYQRIANDPPADPRRHNRALPRELSIVIATALEKPRDRRYDTALDLADELRRIRERRPIRARAAGPVRRLGRWIAREPAKAAAGALALALTGLIGYGAAAWPGIRRDHAIAQEVLDAKQLEARLQRGYLLLHERRAAEAERIFLEALAIAPGDPDVATGLDVARFRLAYGGSVATLEPPGDLPPGDARTWFTRGARALAVGHATGDAAAFERALEAMIRCNLFAERRRLLYLCGLAHALAHSPRPALSRDVIAALDREAPDDPTARYWAALAESVIDPDAAFARIESWIADGDPLPVTMQLCGRLLYARGDIEEAIRTFESVIERAPDYRPAMHNLGIAYGRVGRKRDARAIYERLVAAHPRQPDGLRNLAIAQRECGDVPAALATLNKLVLLDPKQLDVWVDIARLERDAGRSDKATAAARRALEIDPDCAEAIALLGDASRIGGDEATALDRYRAAVEKEPDNWRTVVALANALCDAKQAEEALPVARRAVTLAPDEALTHQSLGRILDRVGRPADSAKAHLRAVRLDPMNARNHYNLGTARMRARDTRGGIAALNKAIELDPTLATAHCNLGHAHFAMKAYTQALAAFRRGHELGSAQPGWSYPSESWVRKAERLVQLESSLDAVLAGDAEAPPADLMTLADLAFRRGRYADQAHLAGAAFAAAPALAARPGNRYNAACAAALAAAGRGTLPDDFGPDRRSALWTQAVAWLEADLAAWRERLEKGTAGATIRAWVLRYRRATPLAPLRSIDSIDTGSALPEAIRTRCEALWRGFDALAEQAAPR